VHFPTDTHYLIARPGDDRPLTEEIDGYSVDHASLAIRRLEHVARWMTALRLENPASGIGPRDVELVMMQDARELTGSEIRLDYRKEGNRWVKPTIRIKIKNNTKREFYCALLGLSEDFEITASFFPTGSVRLGPEEEAFAFQGKPIPSSVPEALWKHGIIEFRDVLKLIVCTDPFDAKLMEQPALALPAPSRRAFEDAGTREGGRRDSALDRLLRQVHTRKMELAEDQELGDWRTSQVAFTTVRPQDSVAVPEAGRSVSLAPGVSLEGHAALAGASARLSSIPVASRDLGVSALPPVLLDDPVAVRPFEMVPTRGEAPGLSVLELEGIQDPGAVTPDTPLKLEVAQPLGDGEHILPVAFDGEFYLPLGRAERVSENSTRIILERLPGPPPADLPPGPVSTRSLFGAIRIYFQKVLSRVAGFDNPYPVLSAVRFDEVSCPVYASDPEQIRVLAAAARRVLLYIHGIIGETRTMVPSAGLAKIASADGDESLSGYYDLILAFDYESINTTIQQTARDLKARLAAVGLGPHHGKMLHVVAHSMGGLVLRWFIEREGGDQVVQRLVMLGTPNGGSPWPRLQDWATATLGLALNGLTVAVWPAAAIGSLLTAIESIDVALDQMVPGSEFLTELASSHDPGVPYVLVGGDTSLKPAALRPQVNRGGTSLMQRLLNRLSLGEALRLAADQVFLAPNDVAVAVASMSGLGGDRTPPLKILAVSCDHMSYFRDAAGLEALARALSGPGDSEPANLTAAK